MGSPDLFRALTRNLEGGDAHVVDSQEIRLTPYLSIVVAILYMMAADGDLSDRESSQLQSVIGSDADTLRRAVAYAESHSVERFLQEAPAVLDAKNRLCLLMNVCDSLMADGQLEDVELQLFERLLAALGHTRTSFQPYFDIIASKDRTSVLGDFVAAESSSSLTPPMVLVASMLYMMAADGSMDEEEIGRLNAAVGNSPALLKAGLRYVSQVRAPQFLATAAGLLNERQRMCVLLNTCDTMLSDRKLANAERDLFRRMLAAFSVEEKSFEKYLNLLYLKSDVPRDAARPKATGGQQAGAPARLPAREKGKVFERKHTWEEETGEGGEAKARKSRKAHGMADQEQPQSEVSSSISRTMQDNIDRMSQGLDDGIALKSLEENSFDNDLRVGAKSPGNGPADLRAYRDAAGTDTNGKDSSRQGPSDLRGYRDAGAVDAAGAGLSRGGPSDLRGYRDAETIDTAGNGLSRDGPAYIRGSSDAKSTDAAGADDSLQDGPSDLRKLRDANFAEADDGQGPMDGPIDFRIARDAQAQSDSRGSSPRDVMPGRHWQDAGQPGEKRELQDADSACLSSHILDDREAFEGMADDVGSQPPADVDVNERMDAVSDRTRTIRAHLEAMLAAKSIFAASRLPTLPVGPAVRRKAATGAITISKSEAKKAVNTWDDGSRMLLASDQGGPKMSENQGMAPATREEASLNRKLRLTSAALLPTLFLAYGATMVGETATGHTFVTQENMATDARIVHQMASVQQTVYRIAPESVRLSVDKLQGTGLDAAAGAGAAATETALQKSPGSATENELSDRKKADNFLEQRKLELTAQFQRHQGASTVAAERQQWFVYAKSVVLLGLGMAFWGVLFRSMRMLHVSTTAGIAGMILTANGYWLSMQF